MHAQLGEADLSYTLLVSAKAQASSSLSAGAYTARCRAQGRDVVAVPDVAAAMDDGATSITARESPTFTKLLWTVSVYQCFAIQWVSTHAN